MLVVGYGGLGPEQYGLVPGTVSSVGCREYFPRPVVSTSVRETGTVRRVGSRRDERFATRLYVGGGARLAVLSAGLAAIVRISRRGQVSRTRGSWGAFCVGTDPAAPGQASSPPFVTSFSRSLAAIRSPVSAVRSPVRSLVTRSTRNSGRFAASFDVPPGGRIGPRATCFCDRVSSANSTKGGRF